MKATLRPLAAPFLDLMTKMMSNPTALANAQIDLFNDSVTVWRHAAERMFLMRESDAEPARDKRFKHPDWTGNVMFSFVRESYVVVAKSLPLSLLLLGPRRQQGLDPANARKVDFYTSAICRRDFAILNFHIATQSGSAKDNAADGRSESSAGSGESARRPRRGRGTPVHHLDRHEVVPARREHRNDAGQGCLPERFHAAPAIRALHTRRARRRPLLIVPPWINKFYVLDLQPKNSFIKWCVDQGHTVFVISWVNPDERLAQKIFEDYMLEGPLAALDAIDAGTGERKRKRRRLCASAARCSASTLGYLAARVTTVSQARPIS